MTKDQLSAVAVALESTDPAAALEAVRAMCAVHCNDSRWERLWCSAMTVAYGSVGLHASWTDPATGHPTPDALERLPGLRDQMARARERLAGDVAYLMGRAA